MTEKADGGQNGGEIPAETPPSPQKDAKSAKGGKAPKRKTTRRKAKRKTGGSSQKGGRPQWAPTPEERLTIEQMKFCGESENTIARALKVDVDTLRKHCANELKNGHANRRKQVIELLFGAAKDGNVSAIRRLEEMGRVSGAAAALEERAQSGSAPDGAAAPPKADKVGKKAERKAAAEAIASSDSKFAPPAAPRLVVSNE